MASSRTGETQGIWSVGVCNCHAQEWDTAYRVIEDVPVAVLAPAAARTSRAILSLCAISAFNHSSSYMYRHDQLQSHAQLHTAILYSTVNTLRAWPFSLSPPLPPVNWHGWCSRRRRHPPAVEACAGLSLSLSLSSGSPALLSSSHTSRGCKRRISVLSRTSY